MSSPRSRWTSQVVGHEVDLPPLATVADLLADRDQNRFLHLNVDLPTLGRVDTEVEIRAGEPRRLTAELYVPAGEPPFGVLLFLHGGGWYRGSAEDERKLAMQLAEVGAVVVNLDYALAPEHPFPAALEDIADATAWIGRSIADYGGDPDRIAICGASSGANLAAAAINRAAATSGGSPYRALLGFYGLYDAAPLAAFDPNPVPEAYLGRDWRARLEDPSVSPSRGDLTAFPPTYLSCGAADLALRQTLEMTADLATSGVPTTASVVAGADHVFLNIPDVVAGAGAELQRIKSWLAERLEAARPVTASPSNPT
jgi:acetyl esterase